MGEYQDQCILFFATGVQPLIQRRIYKSMNFSKQPLYLHSKEGVWRTSAMVSRWRQHTLRCLSLSISNNKVVSVDLQSLHLWKPEHTSCWPFSFLSTMSKCNCKRGFHVFDSQGFDIFFLNDFCSTRSSWCKFFSIGISLSRLVPLGVGELEQFVFQDANGELILFNPYN